LSALGGVSAAAAALPLHALRPSGLAGFLQGLSPLQAGFLQAQNFTAAAGSGRHRQRRIRAGGR